MFMQNTVPVHGLKADQLRHGEDGGQTGSGLGRYSTKQKIVSGQQLQLAANGSVKWPTTEIRGQ